jgi:hypothetical protein
VGRVGKPIEPALKNAHKLAKRLTNPDLYLERLKRIEDGDYYEFDWQKMNPQGL